MEIRPEVLQKSIESLVKLQEIDAKLFLIRQERETVPPELADAQQKLQNAQRILKSSDRGIRDIERERRSLELRHLTLQEDVKRAEAKKRDVRNTKEEFGASKEYDGITKRLADVKKMLEDKQNAANQTNQNQQGAQKTVEELQVVLTDLEKTRAERVAALDKELQALEARRAEYIQDVDGTVFDLYERVQKIRKGAGIAIVKAGTCTGCFVKIPPQLAHRLDKLEEIITCPSCSRILYPDAPQVMAPSAEKRAAQ